MKGNLLMPLRRIHGWLHEYPHYKALRSELHKNYIPKIRKQLKQNPNSVFLVMTPEHRNLGDHAIAAAESKMLNELGIPYIEITDTELNKLYKANLISVMNGRPIIVNGGGNMGTLWFDAEVTHRAIIKNCPDSAIFIFPNTIFYEDTEWGREEFKKSIKLYNRHKNLHLYAREKRSYEIMKDVYRNTELVPDIALFLDESNRQKYNRNGCLLCLRNDKERTRTLEQEKEIVLQAQSLFGDDVVFTDTLSENAVPFSERASALDKKFAQLVRASLVITDRLHGMILCAITGTPCIVLPSQSHKVISSYEWLENLEYIKVVENVSDIADVYRSIPRERFMYSNENLKVYFEKLQLKLISAVYGGNKL